MNSPVLPRLEEDSESQYDSAQTSPISNVQRPVSPPSSSLLLLPSSTQTPLSSPPPPISEYWPAVLPDRPPNFASVPTSKYAPGFATGPLLDLPLNTRSRPEQAGARRRVDRLETNSDCASIEAFACKRRFHLNCIIPGNDGLEAPECIIKDTICDLCLQFIASSLCLQTYTYPKTRWELRSPSIGDPVARVLFRHYSSLRMSEKSAKAGCELCSRMLNVESSASMTADQIALWIPASGAANSQELSQMPKDASVFSVFPFRQLTEGYMRVEDVAFQFVLAEDDKDCLNIPFDMRRSFGRSPSSHSGSDECFDQIMEWYKNCISRHHTCHRKKYELPKRLLDLAPDDHNLEQIALVESKDLRTDSDKIRYIALSYCWGEQQEFTVTTENVRSMEEGFNLKDLPAVMQDAVAICRRCGFKYLWSKYAIPHHWCWYFDRVSHSWS